MSNTTTSVPAWSALMVDPLNAPVVGKPDDNAMPTNCTRYPDVYNVQADAAGNYVLQITASMAQAAYTAPTVTAGVVTTFGTPVPSSFYTSISTDNQLYRCLGFVVEWIPSFSQLTGSGRVFMGTYMGQLPLNNVVDYFDDPGATAAAIDPVVTIVRPMAPIPPYGLATAATGFDPIFPRALVVLTGLPTTASTISGQIKVTRLYELFPTGSSLPRTTARHSPCNMVDCCIASNIVGQSVTHEVGLNGYEKLVAMAMKIARAASRAFAMYNSNGFSEMARMIQG